jgi:hypothetical protein
MLTTPLESYFSEERPRPRPKTEATSTACWRGYIGTWEIKSNALFLVSTQGTPLTNFFPTAAAPVRAEWFTGTLRLPVAECLRYVHMGFGSFYAKEKYITVKKGLVVAELVIDNRKSGATRSPADIEWVALGAAPIPYNGKWDDGRFIKFYPPADCVKHATRLVTRGVLQAAEADQPCALVIPPTPETEIEVIHLDVLPPSVKIPDRSHVEIEAHYEKKDDKFLFVVDKIRVLPYGETIHRPTNKEMKDAQQSDGEATSKPAPGTGAVSEASHPCRYLSRG